MNTIDNWKQEVFDYNTSLNEQLKQNEKAKSLYYGFDVIDGKIIENPDILFMGINPGKGGGDAHYDVYMESDQMSYIDEDYTLANFAKDIIRNLGVNENDIPNYLSEKCVKTNLYHIITKGDRDIVPVLNTIGEFKCYYKESMRFLDSLIKIIKPKIIIFEGKGPYDEFVEICCETTNTWNYEKEIGYYKLEDLNVHCLGYKRDNFSNVVTDAKSVTDKIKSFNIL